MTYFNNLGQGRVGWRSPSAAVTPSTLWSSIYSVWNADTLGTSLDTSIFRAYNGEAATVTPTQLSTNIFGVWNGEALGTSLDTSIYRVYNGDNVNDTSGNAQNGTNVNNVTFTTGKVGNAFTFNGSNYVALPNTSFRQTGDFSISAWINPSVQGSYNMIFEDYINISGNQYGVALYLQGSRVRFATYNGTGNLAYGNTSTILNNTWQHIVITKTTGNAWKMYINNTLQSLVTVVGNISTNPAYNANNVANIGSDIDTGTRGGYFNGKIDGLTIWNRELSDNEITSLYNSGNGAEYPFSTQTLDSLNDAVGSNHGTRPASTLTGGVLGPAFTTGKIGKAFTFDGLNDIVALPNSSFDFIGDFSISAWVKIPSAPSSYSSIFSNYNYDFVSNYGYLLGVNTNRTISFGAYGAAGSSVVTSTTTLALNTWYHVTVKRDSVAKRSDLYINGVFEVQSPVSSVTIAYGPRAIQPTIGAIRQNNQGTLSTNSYLNGSVDALNVWNRTITNDEITALYNSGNGQQYPFSSVTLSNSILDSVNAQNGTNVNNVTLTTGKVGNAFTFTSAVAGGLSNQYISLPSDGSLNFTGDFSVSAWVYIPSSTSGSDYFYIVNNMGCDSWFTNPVGWRFMLSGNNVVFSIFNHTNTYYSLQAGYQFIPVTGVSPGVWAHLAFSRKGSTGSKIYINGNLVASDANTVNPDYSTAAGTIFPTIGNLYMGVGGSKQNYYYPRGGTKIDAVTIWNKTLTDEEVFNLYNDGAGAEYPFTSQYLTSLNDSIGSNHGTRPASTLTNGVPGPSFTTGKIGKAFNFDGINDFVALPNNSFNSLTGDFSISVWVNFANIGGAKDILSTFTLLGGNYYGFEFYQYGTGLIFGIYNGTTTITSLPNTGAPLSTNTWYNVVITRKASTGTKMYINGTLNNSNTSTQNPVYTTTNYATIGGSNYGGSYINLAAANTKLDAVSVWNRELTATEVTELYNSGNGKQYPTT